VDTERAAWVALALTPGIGPSRLHALVQACHSPLGAISAPFEFLRTVPGSPRRRRRPSPAPP
jgi:hypothetical protein